MADQAVTDFAEFLAGISDDSERARVLARVKMLAMQKAPEEAFEPPIRTLADYLAAEIKVPPILVHPTFLVRGGLNATIGRSGKGKTVMNLNRCLRWAAGRPMFDGWKDADSGEQFLVPDEPLKILIVENEGSAGMFHRQIGIMLNAEGYLDASERKLAQENILIWGDGGYSGLKLDNPALLNGLRAGIEQFKPDAMFIEPFRSLWAGEENSSTEMSVVVDALIGIAADYECGVILSHHERKAGVGDDGEKMSQARGSGVLENFVTVMENFESAKGGEQRELSWSKIRYQNPDRRFPAPVRMEWVMDKSWYKWVPANAIGDAAIAAIRDNSDEPMSLHDIAETLGETQRKMRPIMQALFDEGKVKRLPSIHSGEGSTGHRYRLPTTDGEGEGLAI